MLRLLALACRGAGATGLEDYEPPSVKLAEHLAGQGEPEPVERGEMRRQQVAAFVAEHGGEAG
jgi:hypothetical protein